MTEERTTEPKSGVEVLTEHLVECVKPGAAIVVDGNGDDVIAALLAEGWTWDGNVEVVAGKRIRNLVPPAGTDAQADVEGDA